MSTSPDNFSFVSEFSFVEFVLANLDHLDQMFSAEKKTQISPREGH